MDREKKFVFKKICLVSSAVFSAASGIFGWAAPIGAALGLAASDWNSNSKDLLKKQLNEAVECALARTEEQISTDSGKCIVRELSEAEVDPNNLTELILQTEAYREKYCTSQDAVQIVQIFEIYFREEVCCYEELSRWYVLSTGGATLEKLKEINEAFVKQNLDLNRIVCDVDKVDANVREANKNIKRIRFILENIINEFVFIMVSMAGCLILGVIFGVGRDSFYLYAFSSYLFSALLSYFLHANDLLRKKAQIVISEITVKMIIPTVLSVGSYLMLSAASGSGNISTTTIIETLYIAGGSVLSISLKQSCRVESILWLHERLL